MIVLPGIARTAHAYVRAILAIVAAVVGVDANHGSTSCNKIQSVATRFNQLQEDSNSFNLLQQDSIRFNLL